MTFDLEGEPIYDPVGCSKGRMAFANSACSKSIVPSPSAKSEMMLLTRPAKLRACSCLFIAGIMQVPKGRVEPILKFVELCPPVY